MFRLTLYRQVLIQGVRFDTVGRDLYKVFGLTLYRQGRIQGVRFDTIQTGTYTECSV